MDVKSHLKYSKDLEEYVETESYEEEIYEKYIDPFEDAFFWRELIDRLAKRDLINKIGFEKFETMGVFKRADLIHKGRLIYQEEFESSGLDKISLIKDSNRH